MPWHTHTHMHMLKNPSHTHTHTEQAHAENTKKLLTQEAHAAKKTLLNTLPTKTGQLMNLPISTHPWLAAEP